MMDEETRINSSPLDCTNGEKPNFIMDTRDLTFYRENSSQFTTSSQCSEGSDINATGETKDSYFNLAADSEIGGITDERINLLKESSDMKKVVASMDSATSSPRLDSFIRGLSLTSYTADTMSISLSSRNSSQDSIITKLSLSNDDDSPCLAAFLSGTNGSVSDSPFSKENQNSLLVVPEFEYKTSILLNRDIEAPCNCHPSGEPCPHSLNKRALNLDLISYEAFENMNSISKMMASQGSLAVNSEAIMTNKLESSTSLSTTIISGSVQGQKAENLNPCAQILNELVQKSPFQTASTPTKTDNEISFTSCKSETKLIPQNCDQIDQDSNDNTIKFNPFDSCVDALQLPTVSPSLFREISPSKRNENKSFRWSIEQISVLNPVNIEMPSSYESPYDPEYEKRAQQAIDTYFETKCVLPSPWTNSSVKNHPALGSLSCTKYSLPVGNCATPHLKKVERDYMHSDPARLNQGSTRKYKNSQSYSVSCQTDLSLPMNLPPELENALAPYFNRQSTSTVDRECNKFSNSSLCRRLLFSNDELNYNTPPSKVSCISDEGRKVTRKNLEESRGLRTPQSFDMSAGSPIVSGIHYDPFINEKNKMIHQTRSSTSPYIARMDMPSISPIPFESDMNKDSKVLSPIAFSAEDNEIFQTPNSTFGPKSSESPSLTFHSIFMNGESNSVINSNLDKPKELTASPQLSPIRTRCIDDTSDTFETTYQSEAIDRTVIDQMLESGEVDVQIEENVKLHRQFASTAILHTSSNENSNSRDTHFNLKDAPLIGNLDKENIVPVINNLDDSISSYSMPATEENISEQKNSKKMKHSRKRGSTRNLVKSKDLPHKKKSARRSSSFKNRNKLLLAGNMSPSVSPINCFEEDLIEMKETHKVTPRFYKTSTEIPSALSSFGPSSEDCKLEVFTDFQMTPSILSDVSMVEAPICLSNLEVGQLSTEENASQDTGYQTGSLLNSASDFSSLPSSSTVSNSFESSRSAPLRTNNAHSVEENGATNSNAITKETKSHAFKLSPVNINKAAASNKLCAINERSGEDISMCEAPPNDMSEATPPLNMSISEAAPLNNSHKFVFKLFGSEDL